MRIFLIVFSLALCQVALSQNVGINSTGAAPVASAMLDISSTSTGLLIPRVALTASNVAGPVSTPATSLLVYNTATAGTAPNNVVPGYYYWTSTAWAPLTPSASTAWLPTGNSGTTAGTNFIGTTDAIDLVVKTNGVEKTRFTSSGNVGIGTATFDGTNPEKLVVNAGTTTSVNAIVGKGSINSYLQLNIQNQSTGTSASSDVVATADNGSEIINYVDMGINGSTYAGGIMGSVNDAYLYNLGQNFLFGTGTAAKSLVFMTGGTAQATNERMRIDGAGLVGVGTNSPTFKLDVNGPIRTGKASTTSGSLVYSNSTNANTVTYNSGITSTSYGLTLPTAQGAANTMMTNDGTGVLTWTTPGAAGAWALDGNSPGTIKSFGTISNIDLPFITNNVERLRVSNIGDVAIGTSTFDGTNPEQLVVNAGVTTSVNAIVGKGSINNYLQLNIQNQSAGTSSSSDVVATSDNGNETTNYVDMGINGSTNASGIMGAANDAYLYNLGQNFLVGTGTAAKSLVFMTGGTAQATNERMRIDGAGLVGVGTNTPTFKFDVNGPIHTGKASSTSGSLVFSNATNANNLTFNSGITSAAYALTLPTAQGGVNTMMTNDGTGVLTWTTPAAAGSAWALNGNSTTIKTLGTITGVDLPFITNNVERMRISTIGDVAIGTTTFDGTNPEQLVVNAGVTTSVNAIVGKGSINSYLQLNIQNQSTGTSASSDVVATADNGNETTNYVDMGINSSTNTSGLMGGIDDAYLYNVGEDFLIGTATPAKTLVFMTGGTSQAANERMRIDGTGKVGIANIAPSEKLDVTGNVRFSGALMPNNNAGNAGEILSSGGAGVSPTWLNAAATLSVYWNYGGNAVPSEQDFGTASNFALPFVTNNTEKMRLFTTGGLAIGASTLDGTNPEKLLVSAGATSSFNAIVGRGTINNYLQLNIQNQSTGGIASSDVVATADNGNEITNFVDMGINSSGNSSGAMGGADDAYLFNQGQNLLIGTGTAAKSLVFMTGGTTQSTNERLRIDGSGNVGIGDNTPGSTLSLSGSLEMKFVSNPINNYVISATDYVIINTAGATAWTNPNPVGIPGRIYRLVNQGTGAVTLQRAVFTANATSTLTLPVGTNYEIISDGVVWRKIN